jgi:phage terminase large subunit-like protein
MQATRPKRTRSGKLAWCYEDCVWFIQQFDLPEGGPVLLEGYAKLILRTIFRTGLVELLTLLPKGNGKTTIMAGLSVFHLLTVPSPQVFIAAADLEQATEMFRFAQHFCESKPSIRRMVNIAESMRVITLRPDPKTGRRTGKIRVLASDKSRGKGKKHSYSPTLALIDELHAHENTSIYVALRSAVFKGKRPEIGLESGICAVISTAGHNINGVLGQLRAQFLAVEQKGGTIQHALVINGEGNPEQGDGRLTIATTATGRNVMLQWALRDGTEGLGPADDPDDMRVVKLANPASFVTPDSLRDAREAPGITTWDFLRWRCNVWTLAFRSWIPGGSWQKMYDDTVPVVEHRTWEGATRDEIRECIAAMGGLGDEVYAAVDMARYRDCAAVGLVFPRGDLNPIVRALIWRSGGTDQPIEYTPVMDALRDLNSGYRLMAVGWDPKYFDQAAETLTGEGLAMVQFPQSPERMCPAAGDARTEIIEAAWAHDGDPILRAHVEAASAIDVGPGAFRVGKAEESGPPIDACVALLMARALSITPAPKPGAAFW